MYRDTHKSLYTVIFFDNARRRKHCTPTPEHRSRRFSRQPSRAIHFHQLQRAKKTNADTSAQIQIQSRTRRYTDTHTHTAAVFYAFQSAMWASDSLRCKCKCIYIHIDIQIYTYYICTDIIKTYEWKASAQRGRNAGPAFWGLKAPEAAQHPPTPAPHHSLDGNRIMPASKLRIHTEYWLEAKSPNLK